MKIQVRSLQEGLPRKVREEYNSKDLDLEFVDLNYLSGIVLDGTIEKFGNTISFDGKLASRIKQICGRCMKEIEGPIEEPFKLVYEIQGRDEIDTLDDLREILILDHPIRFLCKEDCAGLCSHCRSDLNQGPCLCQKK